MAKAMIMPASPGLPVRLVPKVIRNRKGTVHRRLVKITRQESSITRIGQLRKGRAIRQPAGLMQSFGRRSQPQGRPTEVYVAKLLGPDVIVGHVSEAAIDAQLVRHLHSPARLLIDLAVQGGQGMLSGFDTASGQLVFAMWSALPGQQSFAVPHQHGISARSCAVDLISADAIVVSTYHGMPRWSGTLAFRLPVPICTRYANSRP